MLIQRIEGANCVIPGTGEANSVSAHVRLMVVDGEQWIISAWEPTPDELARINNGENIQLAIKGAVMPPCALVVGLL